MDVRADFPILAKYPKLVYLDSACTSLKPLTVIQAESSYYTEFGACAGRSAHQLARKTNEMVEKSRAEVAKFVGADAAGLIWTRNATEGLNLVANASDFSKRRKVVTTAMEHHSALLPLMKLRERRTITLQILPCDERGQVSLDLWQKAIDRETALVVTHSWNNSTGTGQDIKALAGITHDAGALLCIDGAQGVPHHPADFKKDGCDFLCFSGHKMLGPTGIGALAMRPDLLPRMSQFLTGGGTVKTVRQEKIELIDDYNKFEAGIQNYAGILGFAAACDYLKKLGMGEIESHERALGKALLEQLLSAGARIYGPADPSSVSLHGALYSFNFKHGKPHDVALMLDKEDIAVRSGFFCAQMAMESIGARDGAVRASAYLYNTPEDVKRFGDALQKIRILYE